MQNSRKLFLGGKWHFFTWNLALTDSKAESAECSSRWTSAFTSSLASVNWKLRRKCSFTRITLIYLNHKFEGFLAWVVASQNRKGKERITRFLRQNIYFSRCVGRIKMIAFWRLFASASTHTPKKETRQSDRAYFIFYVVLPWSAVENRHCRAGGSINR